ncbi:MAG: type II toxin-antitoxin system VapC family toxin [Acidimicrobiia bacterium]
MILVDTSIWIDHLRHGHRALERLLEHGLVLGHPWVIGEVALGHLAQRQEILALLARLPQATVATSAEVLTFIERHELHGLGIGYVDAQLLAATQLTPDARLWTHDQRLTAAALRLDLAADPRVER